MDSTKNNRDKNNMIIQLQIADLLRKTVISGSGLRDLGGDAYCTVTSCVNLPALVPSAVTATSNSNSPAVDMPL